MKRLATGVLAFALVLPITGSAQSEREWVPGKTVDGQPNIEGYWTSALAVASLDIEGQVPSLFPDMYRMQLKSIVIDPPDGKIPYLPGPRTRRDAIRQNHLDPRPHELDPQSKCLADGVPRINYQLDGVAQILQPPGFVVILYEFQHAYRIIPIGDKPHVGENISLWMGDSRGRWEGNTLVVDVKNHSPHTWLDVVGNHHSDALRVVERWTIAGPDTLNYQATLEDPKTYTKPWTLALTFKREKEPGFQLLEHACYEGEQNSANMSRAR
jgi:hypothetical protein